MTDLARWGYVGAATLSWNEEIALAQFQPGGLGRDQNKIEGNFVIKESHIPTWAVREVTDRELRAEACLGRQSLLGGFSSAWPHSN